MAWFAVTSLMRTVELEFLSPKPRVVLDDTDAAEALHGRLRELVDFLEKSENQFNAEDVAMQDWRARLKDVALTIEDEIESKVIDSYSGGQSTMSSIAESFHSTLEYANEELTKCVKEDLQANGILSSRERIESSSSSSSLPTASELQSTMVGRTAEFQRIKRLLLDGKSEERLVVPIVGMAGIGKTIFARSLYQDPLVKSHFHVLAWATVSTSTTYDRRRILLELLLCIEPKGEEIIHESINDLCDRLRKCLLGRRYMIVLDDIWDNNQWDEIIRSFPEDCNGSRILLTSRHDEVAMYARSYNYCSLNMSFLNSEESWDLFLQKIHPARLRSEVEAIWRHIVNYFKGLPFAIVIAAGLARAINESQWISNEIEKIFYERMCSDLVEGISKILILSYNNLPNFLKICFLYLGIFPESSTIPVKKLIKLWIAEGFVKVEGERSLEEVAKDFLKNLISRSLVLIDKVGLDGEIKTCKVHDIVHEFCKRKAMEERLLHTCRWFSKEKKTCRWISIEGEGVSLNATAFNRLRSIVLFCHDGIHTPIRIANFKKLRVLDLGTLCFPLNLLFKGDVDLVLLRYLALRINYHDEHLEMLKLNVSFNLQTLLLLQDKERRVIYCTFVLQTWPMLRHLQFSPMFRLDTPSVVLEYLQTIYWLHPFQCTKQVFLRIPNAKVMGIFIPRRGVRWRVGSSFFSHDYSLAENWLDDLINLQKLEKLKILSHRDHDDQCIILPDASAFPEKLRMLTLKGTLVPWDAMEVVGMLPNLEVLKLKSGACKGQHWELTGDWFPKLKSLLIQEMELKQWTATDGAFPILERLIIKHCIHLEKIPSTFDELYSLQLIELHGCHSLLVHSANQIQQQQEELFGYNWLVVHDYNTHQVAITIEEKEAESEEFEEQELEKLKDKASYPESSSFARQVLEEEDSKLTDVEFFNCFEDDFDNNDIN